MSSHPRVLIDTNVLVYSVDLRDSGKRDRSRDVLSLLASTGGVLSQQIVSESARVFLERLPHALVPVDVRRFIRGLVAVFPVLPVTPSTALEALRVAERFGVSYWDAQVLATARLNGVTIVLSEDLHDDCDYGGVRVQDPFAADFDVDLFVASLPG